jgi:hypothetical protein
VRTPARGRGRARPIATPGPLRMRDEGAASLEVRCAMSGCGAFAGHGCVTKGWMLGLAVCFAETPADKLGPGAP